MIQTKPQSLSEKREATNPLPTAVWVGETAGDLRFCWDRLKSISRIIHIDEAWTQGVDWSSLKPQYAFIGVGSRSDHVDLWLQTVKENWPKAQLQIILNGWWSGHRRCQPLDESLDVAYWYQWWDCILPHVTTVATDRKKPKLATRVKRIMARAVATPLPTETRLALVLTEGETRRSFWNSGLKNLGWLAAFPTTDSLELVGDFEVVLVDVAASYSKHANTDGREWVEELQKIRMRFPQASIIVVDSFPTLERWDKFAAAGVQIMLPSPFRWHGLCSQSLD
jgi:hypothetical protein